jgi:hypothetical protein
MTVLASTKRYKRRTASGDKYLSIWFTQPMQDHLRGLKGDSVTVEQAVAAALLLAAASPVHFGRALKALAR